MTESTRNPLTLYLTRLAPSSQLTMRYVLQDAADRLGFEDINLEDIDWHLLQPEHVMALVAVLREDGYAPNTSSLYVNAVRGVMNEAWRMSLISQDHLLKMRSVKCLVMRSRVIWLPRRIRLNRKPSSCSPGFSWLRRNSSHASSLAKAQAGAYLINCLLPLPVTCRLRSSKLTWPSSM